MKCKSVLRDITLAMLALSIFDPRSSNCLAQGTAFTYQGQLTFHGSPAPDGLYTMSFATWSDVANGTELAGPVTIPNIEVINGMFTVTVDLGSAVSAQNTGWLQIAVAPNGGGLGGLSPRQKLTPTVGGPMTGFGYTLNGQFQLVVNGGFETGDFSGWTQSGNTVYNSISSSSLYTHSDQFGAELGPYPSLGYLSQTLATSPGQYYLISLWLDSPDGRNPNEFLVQWNGISLSDQSNIAATGWINFQFVVPATGMNTVLELGFLDQPSYLGLDDISVVPFAANSSGYTWDPQGATGGNPYIGSLNGAWENNNWSTSQTGQPTPVAWLEGQAAQFAVHTGTGTPAFTVTMNANHTVAGIFDGAGTLNPCLVTITGIGTMTLPSGVQAFDINSDSSGPGSVTFNNTIVGPGSLSKTGTGTLTLSGANLYSGGTTISTGTLQLGDGSANNGSVLSNITDNATLVFANPNAQTFPGVISGTGAFIKEAAGTLTLTGVNTYSGGTTINAGAVEINAEIGLGAVPASPAVTLTLNGGCLKNNGAGTPLDANRIISLGTNGGYMDTHGGQYLNIFGQITGAGPFYINLDNGPIVLEAENNYTGDTIIGVNGPGYDPSGTAARLLLGTANVLPYGYGHGDVYIYNAYKGQLDLGGVTGAFQAVNINGLWGDGLILNSGAWTPILTVGNNDASSTFGGTIAGSIALTKVGAGVITLTGANTYNGGTIINAGVVRISGDGALGTGASPAFPNMSLDGGCLMNNDSSVALNANRTISLGTSGGYFDAGWGTGNPITVNGQVTGYGPLCINLDSSPVVLANTGNNYTGDTIIGTNGPGFYPPGTSAWLQLGHSDVLPNGSGHGNVYIYNAYRGQLDMNGFNANINGLWGDGLVFNSAAAVCTLFVGNYNASSTFAGTVQSPTLILVKTGSGTFQVTGAVNNGGLTVGGGVLSGTGTINAPTIVDSGATLAPGQTPGGALSISTLTFGSSLRLQGTTRMNIDAGLNNSDQIVMTSGNTVTLGGNLTVLNIGTTAFTVGDTFQLITGNMAGAFSSFNLPALPSAWLWDTSQLAPGGSGTITVILAAPQISSFSPTTGQAPQSLRPGTTVTILGAGFSAGSQVMFGNSQAWATPNFVSSDGAEMLVQVPRYGTTGNLGVQSPGYATVLSTQPFTVNCYRNTFGFSFSNDFNEGNPYDLCGNFTTFFGEGQTMAVDIFGNCVGSPNPLVDLFFGIVAAIGDHGNCMGFSLASQRLMHGDEAFASFPAQMGLPDNTVWNLQGPESMGGVSAVLSNYVQTEQLANFSAESLGHYAISSTENAISATSFSMSNAVWRALNNGDHPIMTIADGFTGGNENAHAVVAYDVEPGSGSVFCFIDVYDPNRPFTGSEEFDTSGVTHTNMEKLSRILLTTDNHWQYFGDFQVPPAPPPPWSGGFNTLVQYNYDVIPVTPTMPVAFLEGGEGLLQLLTTVIFGGAAETTQINDAAGHTMFNTDGTLNLNTNTSIPWATPYAPPTGGSGSGPMFLFGTNGTYTCTVSGASNGTYTANVVNSQYIGRVIDTQTSTDMNDTIILVSRTPSITFATSATNKSLSLQVAAAVSNGVARVATVNTTTYGGGNDTLEFADPQRQIVTFTHHGPATTFSIVLTQPDSKGNPAGFTSSTLNVAADTSVTFSPSNWGAVANAPVTMTSLNAGGQQQTRVYSTGPGQFLANGTFSLNLPGNISVTYVIEASTNLVSWIPLGTVTNVTGILEYTDTNALQFAARFYRAVPQ